MLENVNRDSPSVNLSGQEDNDAEMEEPGQGTNTGGSNSSSNSRPTSKSSSSYTLHAHKEEDEDDLVSVLYLSKKAFRFNCLAGYRVSHATLN